MEGVTGGEEGGEAEAAVHAAVDAEGEEEEEEEEGMAMQCSPPVGAPPPSAPPSPAHNDDDEVADLGAPPHTPAGGASAAEAEADANTMFAASSGLYPSYWCASRLYLRDRGLFSISARWGL